MELEPTIGLEVHVQLNTRAKVFAPSAYVYGAEPNTLLDPVTLALPGTLPVLNAAAIEQVVRLGLMLGCEIAPHCKFDRKNYFYPDLPKNYQISQYDEPICRGGDVEIELPGATPATPGERRRVPLTRIHLEEDPGKLSHSSVGSLIDFNRAGAPLAEIVTEPVIHSAEEAVAFLQALRLLLTYAGVSDADLEKGQLRCDANVSLAEPGSPKLGTRTETKNLNSVSAVRAAIQSEIRRQTQVLRSGGTVDQETRRWDADRGESLVLRTKEEAHDYRHGCFRGFIRFAIASLHTAANWSRCVHGRCVACCSPAFCAKRNGSMLLVNTAAGAFAHCISPRPLRWSRPACHTKTPWRAFISIKNACSVFSP